MEYEILKMIRAEIAKSMDIQTLTKSRQVPTKHAIKLSHETLQVIFGIVPDKKIESKDTASYT